MANIRKRSRKWNVQIRRFDHPSLSKTFISKSDAIQWATKTEVLLDRGGSVLSDINDKLLSLFTYYVLKGLGGAADRNKDKQLTVSELGSYVQSNVKEQAAAKGWNQTPELQGASERVLVRF